MHADVMAVNSCIAERRENGVAIESKCIATRWFYRRVPPFEQGDAA